MLYFPVIIYFMAMKDLVDQTMKMTAESSRFATSMMFLPTSKK